ncbi:MULTISPECIES: vWA domain-containing protein [unclassified Pseudofrankia]|uniref:vWA domain-containing protein n=1 Tax=unclassified Pseudofrankia TaxID=2994372 RepID=UPI0008DA92F9|nr:MULTISPECIES: vWA domain-containing protein [unclassified Pseudofrankia]MDT3443542.1 VWA domain-containing protein [Pseudofrankia sp. BMG5.37]OHV42741.1 hypothetical protein BCD48_30345 [Pseudofrankia sp. BMG5.36]
MKRAAAYGLVCSAVLLLGASAASANGPRALSTPSVNATASASDSGGSGNKDEALQTKPIRVVILVDESGSESDTDVERERSAATLLALGELSSQSQVAVIGFGSSNGPGQSAVDPVCPLTDLGSAANQTFLVRCIAKLHRRDANEGNDTDFAAALGQALSVLDQKTDSIQRANVVFMLTDGQLDVPNSPQYGATPAERNDAARRELTGELADARADGAQIWPLGFGDKINKDALDTLAAGGAQETCNNLPDAKPRATIVSSSNDTLQALVRAYASARCAHAEFGGGNLRPGQSVDLHVSVPEISTDGAFVVLKGDPTVQVSYLDPLGREVGDQASFDGSTFTRGPQGDGVDSLRVANPRPGRWTIRLTAGPGTTKDTEVVAAAIWQGVVRASLVVDPPSPRAGERVAIHIRLRTRTGEIDDPKVLSGVRVGVGVSGDTVPPQLLTLTDDGKGTDQKANDGQFSGQYTVPAGATGVLTFVGTVDAPGVLPDERTYSTEISTGPPPVVAAVSLGDGTVYPGGTVTGKITITNQDGQPHRLRLVLDDLSPGALAQLVPADLVVNSPGAGRTEASFKISFNAATPLGGTSGTVRAVDADQPSKAYAESFFNVTIAKPAPLWKKLIWLYIVAAVLVLAGTFMVSRLVGARRERADVRGLVIQLYRGDQLVHQLRAPARRATEMVFAVREPAGASPTLDRPRAGEKRYVARRGDMGGLVVTQPDNRAVPLRGSQKVSVGDGLEVGYEDTRVTTTAAGQRPTTSGARADSPAPAEDDFWARRSGDGYSSGGMDDARWDDSQFSDADRDAETLTAGSDRGPRPSRGRGARDTGQGLAGHQRRPADDVHEHPTQEAPGGRGRDGGDSGRRPGRGRRP